MDRHAFSWTALLFPFVGLCCVLASGGPFAPPPAGSPERLLHDFERAVKARDEAALERFSTEEALPAVLEVAELIRGDESWTWARTWKGVKGELTHTVGRTIGHRVVQLELEHDEEGWLIVAGGIS